MTLHERIAALERFGYDRNEAHFLVIVALHSGYFLRRQFLSFTQGTKGGKDVALLDTLQARGHVDVSIFRRNRRVYHLGAKPLYDAIGEKDNRNRRERQPSTIKNKLMGLDFVLENPSNEYLATEREKLQYFVTTRQIAPDDLPTRWYPSARGGDPTPKHFVDKYPLFLAPPAGQTTPIPHFCYVDEGLQSTDRFATYLDQYSRLVAALPDFRILYIAQHPGLFASAGRVFEKLSKGREPAKTVRDLDPGLQNLLAYFEARQDYDAQEFSHFDTARLIRFRDEKKRFAGEPYETLYRRWQTAGARAVYGAWNGASPRAETSASRFSTYIVRHDYDLFGTLTSRSKHRPARAQNPTEAQTLDEDLR
jgi:hypothetical protein